MPGLQGSERAIAVWRAPDGDEQLPLVIAFHGKGESQLGPARGYAAWLDRYGLAKAYEALLDSPLSAAAFGGLVRALQVGADGAPLGIWAGALERYSLLSAHLVRRYSNRTNPDYQPAGAFLTG